MGLLRGILIGMIALLAGRALFAEDAAANEKPISRIALGSCDRHNRPTPIWESIVATRPELFLFIGDNIYADTEDMEIMRAKYTMLAAKAGFRELKAACPILATWDDHDYGVDDGGAEYPKKAESQAVFNDFYEVPADSPRRKRPGIYDAEVFGPKGRRVQVILLDTRYFRSPLKRRPGGKTKHRGPYVPSDDRAATMLGPAQWKWLARQLKVPAEVRIIASSIQVVAVEHGWETWGNMPRERERLFRTIAESGAGGVIFISGDRHKGELSRTDSKQSGVGYPIYDLTSSGLNQGGGGSPTEPNQHRLEQYGKENFGTITIDWARNDPTLTLAIHDLAGRPAFAREIHLDELTPGR